MRHLAFVLLASSLLCVTAPALGQDTADPAATSSPFVAVPSTSSSPPAEAAPSTPPPATTEPSTPAPRPDRARFRWGIAAAGGGEFVSDFAFGMGGVEGQIGVQFNELIGLYVHPYLAFGAGTIGSSGVTAFTGTAGASLLVDFTFLDRLFVGVGGGYGILNNPTGPEIHLRVGGYPAMSIDENGYSRQGLQMSLDGRMFFLFSGPSVLPVMQLMFLIGYEAF
jgi:hypothetical protein